ncbi:APC family permease [Periweissella beninensis]|uniref:Amino acid permease n=1 Tax=Periweissella beninensis TaxID=504936 RepID=A0ABT0VMM8_9LACO|nr:APC family permease [Periweissella beninensis]MBM7544284.1 amino acid transporter [Periweissella beninensis]MCM2437785.1 amino acid permease [Periweissella beninensis]MCT4396439.1 amino acid permease [Periweissella beninensis]
MDYQVNEKHKFGLIALILFGINGIIGTGIFLMPNQVYKLVGNGGIIVALLDAILVLTIALSFADMSSRYGNNGGAFLYAKAAFGEYIGYVVGFMTYLIRMIAWAAMIAGLTTALGSTFPVLNTPLASHSTSLVIVVLLTIMNLTGVHLVKAVNSIATVAKLVPLFLFIFIGIFFIKSGNLVPIINYSTNFSNFGSAAVMLLYAFTGFETMTIAAENYRNPEKNLPRAIIIAISIVAFIYVMTIVVSNGILGAHVANSVVPIQAAFRQITGDIGYAIIATGTLISMLGIVIHASFETPRAGQAMAQQGALPHKLAQVNKKGLPTLAIIITGILTLLLTWSGQFAVLAQMSVVARFVQYIPTILASIYFYFIKKGQPGTLKLPLGPVIPIVALLLSVWLLSQAETKLLLFGLAGLVVASLCYLLTKAVKKVK